ncbi:MAG: virulence factor SrfB [Hyphomicrobium sp.]
MSSTAERADDLPGSAEAPTVEAQAEDDRGIVSLIPNSSLQFFDFRIGEVEAVRLRRRFFEDVSDTGDDEGTGGAGDGPVLHVVALDDDIVHHPVTGAVVNASETYAIDGTQAIAPFLDTWIPVPYLRRAGKDEDGTPLLDDGPSNWARLYVTSVGGPDNRRGGYRVILAIDTAIDARTVRGRTQAGPRLDDVHQGDAFEFSDDVDLIGGFVSEAWVDDWLSAVYRERIERRRASEGEDNLQDCSALEHLAHYLTLLSVVRQATEMPVIRFADLPDDQAQWRARGVDLVLDMGTSRTCALLSEKPVAGEQESSRPTLLPLRDFSQPWRRHHDIFSSRMQFAKATFGNEAWSRWSGRTNAFFWPSLARVGNEAERLAVEQPASEDWTGLSSPMHYIWDEQLSPIAWRFAKQNGGGGGRGSLLSGLQLSHVSEAGDVLGPADRQGVATKPRFSRSSLTTFFAVELIAQTIAAMNAPERRTDGRPRVLDRVVLTVPANLAPNEQSILKRRVEAAVRLVWLSLGWLEPGAAFAPRMPEVRFSGDNATNTGLAYLHNEFGHKFKGKIREYLDLMGKQRPEHKSGRSLRIASLDIGGGATCLSVATYELTDAATLVQTTQVADGCRTGGDDILKAIVERHLMPSLERRLVECKLTSAKRFLERVINGKGSRRAAWSGEFGRRFASEIAQPLALSMLETHLGSRVHADVPIERSLGNLISLHSTDARAVLDEFDELATEEGADAFSPHETIISFRDRDISSTIKSVLEPVIGNVARIVQALDCDVLLISGWPSRLPIVVDMLVERMPSQPNRIVSMADYRVGDWYALRERSGTVGDTKSMAVMGAMLACQGMAGGVQNLTLRPLDADAARLHIGRMTERDLVANDTVLFVFGDPALGKDPAGREARTCTLSVEPPVLLGGRRIGLENWPATPMFWLDHEPFDQRTRKRGPLKVTIERVPGDRGQPDTLRVVRACDADGNNLAPSEMALRLQTLRSPKGHWLDTGAIAIE